MKKWFSIYYNTILKDKTWHKKKTLAVKMLTEGEQRQTKTFTADCSGSNKWIRTNHCRLKSISWGANRDIKNKTTEQRQRNFKYF